MSDVFPGSELLRFTPADEAYYLYQAFLAPVPAKRLNLHHIGLTTHRLNGGFIVSSVLEGYPAHSNGLRRGDKLLEVDGQPFDPVNAFAPGEHATGHDSGGRRLTWQRHGGRHNAIVRPVHGNLYDAYRSATANSVSTFPTGNKIIGYLHLWSLARSLNDLKFYNDLLASLRYCDGIVLDLRDCFGYLDWQHLDAFFSSRRSYLVINADGDERRAPPQENSGNLDMPVVALINESTRAGGELLAYQLKKTRRAILVGTRTAGMAGGIEKMRLDPEGGLLYPVPAGYAVDGDKQVSDGIEPHDTVSYGLERPGKVDPQIEMALSIMMGTI